MRAAARYPGGRGGEGIFTEQTAHSEHPSARTAALHGVETVVNMPNGVRKDVYKALARHPDLSVNAPVGDIRRLTVKVWLVRTASTALKLCSVKPSGAIDVYNERNALPLDQRVDRLTARPHGRWELHEIRHSDQFQSSCEEHLPRCNSSSSGGLTMSYDDLKGWLKGPRSFPEGVK